MRVYVIRQIQVPDVDAGSLVGVMEAEVTAIKWLERFLGKQAAGYSLRYVGPVNDTTTRGEDFLAVAIAGRPFTLTRHGSDGVRPGNFYQLYLTPSLKL